MLGVLFGFAGPASAAPGGYRVLIVHSDRFHPPTTLRNEIAAFPDVASVDIFDAHVSTPTAAQLEAYDLVVSQSGDNRYLDQASYGNALADYYDHGGVVIQFAWDNDSYTGYPTTGRWASGGYQPFIPGVTHNVSSTLGTHDTSSPLMQGVNALRASDRTTPTVAPGATLVASWADGDKLIAAKGRAVSVSAYVGDDYGGSPTNWSGDFARLAINTARVGKPTLSVAKTGNGSGTITSSPAGINCGATCASHYVNGSSVKLTASASPGSAFTGWSGGGCSGTSTCTVTMNAAQAVTATLASHNTTITGAKINRKKHTARFKFSSSGAVSGWQCALVRPKKNGKLPKHPKLKWRSCKSPKLYKHLKHGHYKFEVRATNSAGPDPNPAIKKFKI